jgi:hypothetical protein
MNMDSPKFISPDPDILRATMEKRKRIEDDAQKLLQQAVASLTVTRSSAESKRMDDADFTTGLVTVCNALQDAEKSIIRTWNAYEQGKTAKDIEPLIDYPGRFDVHDDSSRSAELELTSKMLDRSPSPAWKKILHARLVRTYHRNGLPRDIEELITKEIERMPTIVLDPDTVIADHTAGFVSDATASTMRGYPPLEAAQAAIDHAERAKRILSAQTSDFGARGVQDADPDLGSSDKEKED